MNNKSITKKKFFGRGAWISFLAGVVVHSIFDNPGIEFIAEGLIFFGVLSGIVYEFFYLKEKINVWREKKKA